MLYHIIPKEMKGDILHPVSRLKFHFPELYRHKRQKREDKRYRDREIIPYVNARWSDTLHFIMAHPEEIRSVLNKIGIKKSVAFWKIHPGSIRQSKAIIFHGKKGDNWYHPANFTAFDSEVIKQYRKLSPAIIDYYTRYASAEDVDILHPLPQVLFKGSLNIANCDVVEL